LRVVLDTCILKLATFPADDNASALVYELVRAGLIEAWVSPAILEEYATSSATIQNSSLKSSKASLSAIRSPSSVSSGTNPTDNRFLECALAAHAEFIVTVNTAPWHFDRKQYQSVNVVRPSEFLNVQEVGRLVKKLIRG
jgi:predicted nucleic acid-binding protein